MSNIPMRIDPRRPAKSRHTKWVHHDLESVQTLYPNARIYHHLGTAVVYSDSEIEAQAIAEVCNGTLSWGVLFGRLETLRYHLLKNEIEEFIKNKRTFNPDLQCVVEGGYDYRTRGIDPVIAYVNDPKIAMLMKLTIIV